MRRAATRAFRTCQCTVRGHRGLSYRANRRGSYVHSSLLQSQIPAHSQQSLRFSFTSRAPIKHAHTVREPLQSSMNARRATVALLSGIVGYGAYYTYNGNSTDSAAALTRGFSSSSSSSTSPGDAIPTRSVLVIGAEELSTGTFVGEGPISKTTDDEGRAIVEMLTADQSTQKLRKMEESYLVNRGKGVVRYDQVQLPSNNPIEDDHAEKIVEVPVRGDSESGSDWMFWGVFDGHS